MKNFIFLRLLPVPEIKTAVFTFLRPITLPLNFNLLVPLDIFPMI